MQQFTITLQGSDWVGFTGIGLRTYLTINDRVEKYSRRKAAGYIQTDHVVAPAQSVVHIAATTAAGGQDTFRVFVDGVRVGTSFSIFDYTLTSNIIIETSFNTNASVRGRVDIYTN